MAPLSLWDENLKDVLHQLVTKHCKTNFTHFFLQFASKYVFLDLVVVLTEKLQLLDRMLRDVMKTSLAKMDHLVVVQTNGLLRRDLISKAALSVLRRYVLS